MEILAPMVFVVVVSCFVLAIILRAKKEQDWRRIYFRSAAPLWTQSESCLFCEFK